MQAVLQQALANAAPGALAAHPCPPPGSHQCTWWGAHIAAHPTSHGCELGLLLCFAYQYGRLVPLDFSLRMHQATLTQCITAQAFASASRVRSTLQLAACVCAASYPAVPCAWLAHDAPAQRQGGKTAASPKCLHKRLLLPWRRFIGGAGSRPRGRPGGPRRCSSCSASTGLRQRATHRARSTGAVAVRERVAAWAAAAAAAAAAGWCAAVGADPAAPTGAHPPFPLSFLFCLSARATDRPACCATWVGKV